MESQPVASGEQRRASRFPRERDTEFALVQHPNGEEVLAEVRDESLGGLGLYLNDATGFAPGQSVTIVYRRDTYQGQVRHVDSLPSGEFFVGFSCTPVS